MTPPLPLPETTLTQAQAVATVERLEAVVRPQNTDWLPTAYRGSLAMDAEAQLRARIGASPHGTRNAERWSGGVLQHRCTDIKSGAAVIVANNPNPYGKALFVEFCDPAEALLTLINDDLAGEVEALKSEGEA